ncbi:MAG: HEPN domain-containing protein [Methanocellales archaeon]|nr:HEPN domain-containing protein [Methanocellales archaeon]
MRFEEITKAFLIEADTDMKLAKAAYENDIHSGCVYHCQQCVEKSMKAVLAIMGTVGIIKHEVTDIFESKITNKIPLNENIKRVIDHGRFFESLGTKPRYPLFGRPDLPVWIPTKEYRKEDAEDALQKAIFVFENLTTLLKEVYEIEL